MRSPALPGLGEGRTILPSDPARITEMSSHKIISIPQADDGMWETYILPVPKSDPVMVRVATKHRHKREYDEAKNQDDFAGSKVKLCLWTRVYIIHAI